jgi:hypothetical protein
MEILAFFSNASQFPAAYLSYGISFDTKYAFHFVHPLKPSG